MEMDRVLLLPSDETLKKLGASPLILGSIAELELYTELRRYCCTGLWICVWCFGVSNRCRLCGSGFWG